MFLMIASGGKVFAQESKGNESANKLNGKATIAGKTGGEITRKDLLKAKELMVDKAGSHITDFKMTVVNAGGQEEFTGKGNKLSEAMRNAIKNASPHAKVFFEYIRCVEKDGGSHLLSPISLELK